MANGRGIHGFAEIILETKMLALGSTYLAPVRAVQSSGALTPVGSDQSRREPCTRLEFIGFRV